MKKILLLFILLTLNACIGHISENKYTETASFKEILKIQGDPLITNDFIDFSYYNKNNIVKLFGEPLSIKELDNTTILYYETNSYQPQNTLFLFFPIKYKTGNNKYKYSFELKNNQLENIIYEDIKTKFISVIPLFIFNNKKYIIPFDYQICNTKNFKNISGTFPHMNSNYSKIKKNCYSSKFFNFDILKSFVTDFKQGDKGYTKISSSNIFLYNKEILKISKYKQYYQKTAEEADKERLIDANLTKQKIKTDYLDCTIFMKTGKDYKANNKGKNSYLILDNFGALCFTKYDNMLIDIQNSNRYPEDLKHNINTLEELKNIIKTIKID